MVWFKPHNQQSSVKLFLHFLIIYGIVSDWKFTCTRTCCGLLLWLVLQWACSSVSSFHLFYFYTSFFIFLKCVCVRQLAPLMEHLVVVSNLMEWITPFTLFIISIVVLILFIYWNLNSYLIRHANDFQAVTGDVIVSRFQRSRSLLEQSLGQIQTMVPVMLAVEVCHMPFWTLIFFSSFFLFIFSFSIPLPTKIEKYIYIYIYEQWIYIFYGVIRAVPQLYFVQNKWYSC